MNEAVQSVVTRYAARYCSVTSIAGLEGAVAALLLLFFHIAFALLFGSIVSDFYFRILPEKTKL